MKVPHGFSLVEMMVGVGIVSVVGVGMYTGFQQLDDAQQAARQIADSTNQKVLLLDLIETEISLAGTSIDGQDTLCTINASGSSEWLSSCDGDVIESDGQSHGVSICREANGRLQNTIFYVSGPIPYQQSLHQDLRCGSEKGPFFDVYSARNIGSCDLPAPSQLNETNLRSKNLCELEFRKVDNGLSINLTTSGRLTGELVGGNSFEFRNQASLSEQTTVISKDSLLNDPDNYLVSLEQAQFFTDGLTSANIFLNKVAVQPVVINYQVINADGTVAHANCSVTIPAGEIAASIPIPDSPCTLASGQKLELLVSPPAFLGDIPSIEVFSAASAAGTTPHIRFVLHERAISYGQDPVSFYVIADRAITQASGAVRVRANNSLTGGPSISYGDSFDSGSPGKIRLVSASAALTTDPTSFYLTSRTVRLELEAASTSGAITDDQTFDLSLEAASGSSINPDWLISSNTDRLRIVTDPEIPRLSWLQKNAEVKEPVEGETRTTVAILLAEPPPTQTTEVTLVPSIASGANCFANAPSSPTAGGFSINSLNADSNASCTSVTIGPGQSRVPFLLEVHPHVGILRASASSNLSVHIDIASGPTSGAMYEVTEDNQLLIEITEEQVPQLLAASTARVSTFAGQSRAHNLATASINDFQTATNPPTIRVQDGRQSILVYEEATSDEAWASGSIPITLNEVDIGGSGSIYVKVASAASALSNEHLTYGTDFVIGSTVASAIQADEAFEITFNDSSNNSESSNPSVPFWVYNDLDEEGDERISLYIHRATGQGLTRSPDTDADGYSIDVTVIDRDQCAIAGDGMTIGDSITDDFHTVDSDDMVNANLSAATVRISSGYDSTNDKLVVAGDAQTDSLTVTEANGIITYTNAVVNYPASSSTIYNLTARFFIAQGVLEISTNGGTIPAPAMVKFFNESVKFQTTAAGTTNREATFTLGNAQAWNAHEDGHTHYYRFVPSTLIQFNAAKDAANDIANGYFGVPGYLATVTSRAENTFLAEKFNSNGGPPAGWLGGWDDTEDTWIWMNGPENGRRILSENTSPGNGCGTQVHVIRGEGNGPGNDNSPISVSNYNQNIAKNGSLHATGSWNNGNSNDLQNMSFTQYSETIDSVTGRVVHPANPYRFQNFGACEPNDAGPYEDKLQMTGNDVGGRLWNDLPGDLNTITGNYAAYDSPYSVSGYYQEFGGPERSKWGFYNRKFSQTNNFQTGLCNVTDATPAAASCTAYSDLTIGLDDDGSEGFNFYGPGSDVDNAQISQGRVSISSGYMKTTDSLEIDGHPVSPTSTATEKKYLNFSLDFDGAPIHGFNATFFVNDGVMEISRAPGATPATVSTNAMVKLFSERVKLVIDDLTDTTERQVTYTLGDAQAWFGHPDMGDRYYKFFPGHYDWTVAKTRAENADHEYFGVRGYLATITSFAENKLLSQKFNDEGGPPSGWLGGRAKASDDDDWIWNAGPEDGVRFWHDHDGDGRPINGTSDAGQILSASTSTKVPQTLEWNGSEHVADPNDGLRDDNSRRDYGYSIDDVNTPPLLRFANWSASSQCCTMEPNNNAEDFLQMTGSGFGGGMWNDVRNDQPSVDDLSDDSPYGIGGYYVEYGGPTTFTHNFYDRKLGQTMSISPVSCEMERVENMGCLPGTGLTIGSTSSFDFYGPNTDVVNANITGARVQIIQNFVSNSNTDRDELALRGALGELINGGKTKRYQDIPLINGTQVIDVDGEYDFVSGVLKITSDSAVPASEMVTFLSQRVQLIEAGSSTGAKDISFTLGDALIWNGHEDNVQRYYRFVSDVGGTWTNARSNAQSSAQNYFGVPGYLATITSKAENDFIAESFSNDGSPVAGWLGGSDNRSSGVWEWVTGPEGGNTSVSGTSTSNRIKFWDGNTGTSTKPVNLSGTSITGNPPTTGHSMLTNAIGCSNGDAACCENQYSGYHGQTPAEATAAATELGQSGTALTHHFFGYTESVDANGQVTPNSSKRFANWACNGSTPQPSDSSGQNFLLITGSPLGNGMWNDVDDDGITSSADIYAQQGYYVEYGGGTVAGGGSWSHNFNDRRIGRVVRIPQGCELPDAGFSRID